MKDGNKDIHFLPSKGLIIDEEEATVDGAHMTDLDFYRIINAVENFIINKFH